MIPVTIFEKLNPQRHTHTQNYALPSAAIFRGHTPANRIQALRFVLVIYHPTGRDPIGTNVRKGAICSLGSYLAKIRARVPAI